MFSSIRMTFLCADISFVETFTGPLRTFIMPGRPRPPGPPRPIMPPGTLLAGAHPAALLDLAPARGSNCTRRGMAPVAPPPIPGALCADRRRHRNAGATRPVLDAGLRRRSTARRRRRRRTAGAAKLLPPSRRARGLDRRGLGRRRAACGTLDRLHRREATEPAQAAAACTDGGGGSTSGAACDRAAPTAGASRRSAGMPELRRRSSRTTERATTSRLGKAGPAARRCRPARLGRGRGGRRGESRRPRSRCADLRAPRGRPGSASYRPSSSRRCAARLARRQPDGAGCRARAGAPATGRGGRASGAAGPDFRSKRRWSGSSDLREVRPTRRPSSSGDRRLRSAHGLAPTPAPTRPATSRPRDA